MALLASETESISLGSLLLESISLGSLLLESISLGSLLLVATLDHTMRGAQGSPLSFSK